MHARAVHVRWSRPSRFDNVRTHMGSFFTYMAHVQVGIPVGAAVFGTAFTFLGVLAARRDERLFKEQAEVCVRAANRYCYVLPSWLATRQRSLGGLLWANVSVRTRANEYPLFPFPPPTPPLPAPALRASPLSPPLRLAA